MTDPLSVSASIITLVGTGFAVAQGLYQVASGIGSAGQEVRIYADEIDSFAKLLAKIQEELDQRPQIASRRAQGLLEDIFAVCKRVLDPMNHIQETLNPLLIRFKDSQSKLRQFGLRVQWMFATKDKLLFYRGALKGQHRLLDTTLAVMILMAVGQNPRIVIHQLSIENSIAGIKSMLNDSKALQIENVEHSSSRLLLSGGNGTGTRGLASAASNDASTDDGSTMTQEQGAADSIQSLTLSTRPGHLSILHESNSESESIDEIINETLEEKFEGESEDSARDLWEDMRAVSRKVLRYASDALKDSHEQHEIPNPPESAESADRSTQDSVFPEPAVLNELLVPYDVTPDPTYRQSRRRRRSLDVEDNIMVKVRAKNYQLPLAQVADWTRMYALLLSIHQPKKHHSDSLDLIAIKGHEFDLIGPEGQTILPQYWTHLVQPGWTIQLLFPGQKYVKEDVESAPKDLEPMPKKFSRLSKMLKG